MIRDPRVLEQLDQCEVLVLDKTGTLTLGRPRVVDLHTDGADETEVLQLTAAAEAYSKHPLALAVIDASRERGSEQLSATAVEEPPGKGLIHILFKIGSQAALGNI